MTGTTIVLRCDFVVRVVFVVVKNKIPAFPLRPTGFAGQVAGMTGTKQEKEEKMNRKNEAHDGQDEAA
jgi:hypothetical protein